MDYIKPEVLITPATLQIQSPKTKEHYSESARGLNVAVA
jgi:hypothetical protein